jgi:hypothetical protein
MQSVALSGIRNADIDVAGMELRNTKKEGQNRKTMYEKGEVLRERKEVNEWVVVD